MSTMIALCVYWILLKNLNQATIVYGDWIMPSQMANRILQCIHFAPGHGLQVQNMQVIYERLLCILSTKYHQACPHKGYWLSTTRNLSDHPQMTKFLFIPKGETPIDN